MRKLIPCLLAALICLPGMAAPEAARAADAEYVLVVYNLDNLLAAPKFNSIKGLANYLK